MAEPYANVTDSSVLLRSDMFTDSAQNDKPAIHSRIPDFIFMICVTGLYLPCDELASSSWM